MMDVMGKTGAADAFLDEVNKIKTARRDGFATDAGAPSDAQGSSLPGSSDAKGSYRFLTNPNPNSNLTLTQP